MGFLLQCAFLGGMNIFFSTEIITCIEKIENPALLIFRENRNENLAIFLRELSSLYIFAGDFHENEYTDFCEHFCKNKRDDSFPINPIKDYLAFLLSILAV